MESLVIFALIVHGCILFYVFLLLSKLLVKLSPMTKEQLPQKVQVMKTISAAEESVDNSEFSNHFGEMHVKSLPELPLADAEQRAALHSLREMVLEVGGHDNAPKMWRERLADEQWCCRFLVAREWNPVRAAEIMLEALRWREKRQPIGILTDASDPASEALRHESCTGKIVCPGRDRHGRSVIVFDNSVQNTKDHVGQVRLLAYSLEFALRQCAPHSDKICLVVKLNNFSLLNNPSWAVTKETIRMLGNCYPETLGLCVVYRPPQVFSAIWSIASPLIDPRTSSKVMFVTGDVSEGSSNDRMLSELIAPEWRTLCGCETPVLYPKCTAGFDPTRYWDSVLEREREWLRAQQDASG